VYENGTSEALYAGTDVGVYYRDASLTEWIPFNNKLPNVIVNDLEIHYNADSNTLLAGTFGRGVWESPTPPKAEFEADQTEVCINRNVVFNDLSYISIADYEWDFGESAQPQTATGAGPHNVTYRTAGSKTIKLTVLSAAKFNTEIKYDYITVRPENFLNIAPNPNFGLFQIKYFSTSTAQLQISIFDQYGKKLFSENRNKDTDVFDAQIDITGIDSGIYTIEIEQDSKITSKQIVVVRNNANNK